MAKLLCVVLAFASLSQAQDGKGMLGLNIKKYNPVCASACTSSTQTAKLSCSKITDSKTSTPPQCYATNEPYLTTNAYCIQQHCNGQSIELLEFFWRNKITASSGNPPYPKWTYQETLGHIVGKPQGTVVAKKSLNATSKIPDDTWNKYRNTYAMDMAYQKKESLYSVIVVTTVLSIPLILAVLQKIVPESSLGAKLKSVLVIPALIGSKSRVPAWGGFGLQPTRGIAILILYMLVINLLLSVLDYPTTQPNTRYATKEKQIMIGLALRVGFLSFANMALSIFLAGRNTFLLWLTGWSRSTYLLIHRWVAYVSILQAAVHSLIYVRHYATGHNYSPNAVKKFFIWGTVAMLAMTGLWLFSCLPIRRRFYEVFLIGHITFSIVALVGCWYHVWESFHNRWGFEIWLYAAFAAWGLDRVFRILRMARWGVKRATITKIDDDYFRIDIPNASMKGHAFLYFPTLSWRVWENHPFSIASSLDVPQQNNESKSITSVSGSENGTDLEKPSELTQTSVIPVSGDSSPINQLTFFVRAEKGATARLAKRAGTNLPVLIEGGYAKIRNSKAHPQLVAIVGGVGISTVLPIIRAHPGSAKVYWGVRNDALVNHMRKSGILDGIDIVEISVGKRLDVQAILETEIDGRVKSPMVVVSGPAAMSDDVRAITSDIMRKTGINVRLVDESFSW